MQIIIPAEGEIQRSNFLVYVPYTYYGAVDKLIQLPLSYLYGLESGEPASSEPCSFRDSSASSQSATPFSSPGTKCAFVRSSPTSDAGDDGANSFNAG